MDAAAIRFQFSLFMGLLFLFIGFNVRDLSVFFVPGSLMTSCSMLYLCLERRHRMRFETVLLEKPEECIICFETIDRGAKLDCVCRFFYHEKCIRKWFHERPECPICKKVFFDIR